MKFLLSILFFAISTSTFNVIGQIRTSKIFTNNAILQRNITVPVWGWGNPSSQVKVTLNNISYNTKVDLNGEWKVLLKPQNASGPFSMLIESDGELIKYDDIYFGDVWLCSGQSNMEWILKNTNDAKKEIAEMKDPLIRHFKVPRSNADEPENELEGGEWVQGNKNTVENFTAIGYYFAKELRAEFDVPIGLLNSSWGGSRIEPWISKTMLDARHPEYDYESYTSNNPSGNKAEEKYKKMFPGITEIDAGMKGEQFIWASDIQDESKWNNIEIQTLWENQGYGNFDGIGWYRSQFTLTQNELNSDIILNLGTIDDSDQTFVNGILVGNTMNAYNKERNYNIEKSLLKAGENTLTIRVTDTGGGGGLYESEFKRNIKTGTKLIELGDLEWKIRMGAYWVNKRSNQIPNIIYNKMIHPIINFPIKGVIWYQGESNAGNIKTAFDYRYLLTTLIEEWREKWQNPELPFLYVQLANFQEPKENPGNDGWAVIRESMNEVLKVPYTGQAVIIDIGEAGDIHPRNKEDVGKRLALQAKKVAYHQDLVYSSPMYSGHTINKNQVILEFDHIGGGLVAKDKYGYLKGFSIAGKDKKFVWAKAKIVGNKINVYSNIIRNPVAVRYAWEINPSDANLYNKEGLPASPFRTDNWELEE
jgi:sialate O-acetylesterase